MGLFDDDRPPVREPDREPDRAPDRAPELSRGRFDDEPAFSSSAAGSFATAGSSQRQCFAAFEGRQRVGIV